MLYNRDVLLGKILFKKNFTQKTFYCNTVVLSRVNKYYRQIWEFSDGKLLLATAKNNKYSKIVHEKKKFCSMFQFKCTCAVMAVCWKE